MVPSFKNIYGLTYLRLFRRKSKSAFITEGNECKLERNLSAIDLIAIGVGSTVGSGIFVLTGLIASTYAGPGVVWSWLIAGVGCVFSAMSYAEMSSRIPSSGSSYAYVYYSLGEFPAVITAWCLTLEYGMSGAAVARSWGDKMVSWLHSLGVEVWTPFNPGYNVNIFAGLLQLMSTGALLLDANTGKMTIYFFTVLKLALIGFITIAGLSLFMSKNVHNWAPYGSGGVLRGATSAFFGYIGYDEVCCMAAETKNPQKMLPIAIFGTIGIVTVLYVLASLALVGMMPSDQISPDSGFSTAFADRLVNQLIATGELITLPLVVLLSLLAQPRVFFAMAEDGLLPKMFSVISPRGVLRNNILVCGAVFTVVSIFIPFTYLNDMISAGVLISFNMTNSSLIMVRRGYAIVANRCVRLLTWFHVFALLVAVAVTILLGVLDSNLYVQNE
eukprot:gene7041-14322_t